MAEVMDNLSYHELENETIEFISKNKLMVLSTCSAQRVTARMMSIINQELTIYFQAAKKSVKYQQIMDNANVALCIGNMQYEGTAKITCQPLENPFFAENYLQHHEGSFKAYSHLKDEVIIEVRPTLVTFWKYNTAGPFRDFLDVAHHEAYRKSYNTEA